MTGVGEKGGGFEMDEKKGLRALAGPRREGGREVFARISGQALARKGVDGSEETKHTCAEWGETSIENGIVRLGIAATWVRPGSRGRSRDSNQNQMETKAVPSRVWEGRRAKKKKKKKKKKKQKKKNKKTGGRKRRERRKNAS